MTKAHDDAPPPAPQAPAPQASRDALSLVALYGVLAGLWIALSDTLVVALFGGDAKALAVAQSVKGIAFVIFTALALLVAAGRAFRRRDALVRRLGVSEATYRALVEGQSDPLLLIAPDLSVVYGNQAGRACFPGPAQRLSDLFTPDMLDLLCAELARLAPERPVSRVDLPTSGDGAWYAWTARAVYDDSGTLLHYQLTGHDITSHRRAEQNLRATQDCLETAIAARTAELEESNRRLADFAQVSSDWLWEIDARGCVTFLSDTYPWGDPAGLIGHPILEVAPWRVEDGSPEENERMLAFASGRQPFRDLERAVRGPDGTLRYYRIKARPMLDSDGKLQGWRGGGIDMTARKLAELALLAAQEELEQRVRDRTRALEQEVADRLRAEDALAGDRALLRCLLDSIPDLIFVKDPEGRYLVGNVAFSAFVGRAEKDYVGATDFDLFPREVAAFFRSQDRQMFAEGGARTNEEWVDYPDGRRVLLDTLKTPYFGPAGELMGLVGISRDITRRKIAEDALRASEERFRQLVEDVDAIAWEWDVATRRYVYVSPQGQRLTGFAAEEWCQPDFWPQHIHADDRDQALTARDAAARTGQNHESEYRLLCADGAMVWVRDIVHVHSEDGLPRRLRGLMIDVTDRRMAEAQMIQASKLATLGEMAAGMAHELNQPLNIIRMAADARLMDIADDIDDPPAVEGSLHTIAQQCRRMAEIIAHTRVFSRAEDEGNVTFDAWAAVEAAVEMVRQQFSLAGIAIDWIRPARPAPVLGNPLRLEQVALNLLSNARDALKDGAGAKAITVTGRADRAAGSLRLTVADTGPGIPPDRLGRIFEPFYTTKGPGEGTGLGLSISLHIVNGMRGGIEAADTGTGASFTVTLPLAAEDGTDARPRAKAPAPAASAAHLLVVDDEPLAGRYMAELLRRSGYRVTIAGDGEEALTLFAADPADLVVTDARMPKLDGRELIGRLHDIEPRLPVIVVSGQHDVDQLIAVGRRRGEAVRILPKPIDIVELRHAVAETLLLSPAAARIAR